MINELIKLATHLDSKGLTKEADYLDAIIKSAYCKPPMVWNNDLKGCMSPNLGEGSTSYTTKSEDHCAAKGLTKGTPQYNKCITQAQNRLQAGKKLAADRNYKIVKEAQTVPGSRKPWHNSIKDVIGALRRANQDLHTGDPTGMAKKTFDAVYKAIDTDYRQGESQSNREKAREYRQGVTQPLAQQRRETSQNP